MAAPDHRQVGLFGGTFNPIHLCHLRIAEQVQATMNLERVVFIPTGDPPHKHSTALAPAHHRYEMVRLAIEPYPTFEISDVEVRSQAISFTVNTVTWFKAHHSTDIDWSFILGLDALLDFPSWRNVPRLLELCDFIVCSRPGASFADLAGLKDLPYFNNQADLEALETGQSSRLDIPLPTGRRLTLLALPPCEASASSIRRDIALGRSVSRWLPPSVESYIIHHRLYQCPHS